MQVAQGCILLQLGWRLQPLSKDHRPGQAILLEMHRAKATRWQGRPGYLAVTSQLLASLLLTLKWDCPAVGPVGATKVQDSSLQLWPGWGFG